MLEKNIVIDYWDFNFKGAIHAKYLYNIVFKKFDFENKTAKKIRCYYFLQFLFSFLEINMLDV